MRFHCFWMILSVVWCFLGSAANAQVSPGFSLNRYEPAERGSDWLVGESLDLRGTLKSRWGLTADYAYRPLVLYEGDDDSTPIVSNDVYGHVGGALVLWDRLRVGLSFPLQLFNSGQSVTVDETVYHAETGIAAGDLRLGADVRLAGTYGDVFTLAIGSRFFLPTGSVKGYTSDGKIRVEPRLIAAGAYRSLVYAARLSFLYRGLTAAVAGEPYGSEMGAALSVGWRGLHNNLVVGPELSAATVVAKSRAVFKSYTTPVEAIISAKYRFSDLGVGLGAGPGLNHGFGTPALRIVGSIEWLPESSPARQSVRTSGDTDHDGIPDARDACVNAPGLLNQDPEINGCPAPEDRDGDGILDKNDACPEELGTDSDDPKRNGCPVPPDRDGDKISDDVDACPDQQGEPNEDPIRNGCAPLPDHDGDGIIDDQDACPEQKGIPNRNARKNGCPLVAITKDQIVINERIEFEVDEMVLRPESEVVLAAIVTVLNEHPEIAKVSVEGHTDNRGTRRRNLEMSRLRAAAVVNWLIGHGIDKSRLVSVGYGKEKPIDTNNTESGRQNNRRVEFRIVKQNLKSKEGTR
jgi:OmpA-OmpF porin, OOP family